MEAKKMDFGMRLRVNANANFSTQCICNRPTCNVICQSCGSLTKGRVRRPCYQHPEIVFLYDYSQCPRCRSNDFMLTEILD